MSVQPDSRGSAGVGPSFVRFASLGVLSYATNVGLTFVLHEWYALPAEAAFAAALVTVFCMNFLLMRYYVYPGLRGGLGRQLAQFGVTSALFRGGEYVAFLVLHSWLGTHYLPAIVAVTGAAFVAKFFYYRTAVFVGRKCA